MVRDSRLPILIPKFASLFLMVVGALFYISWGVMYSTWTDIGVYSVTIVLLGIGFSGFFLFHFGFEEDMKKLMEEEN